MTKPTKGNGAGPIVAPPFHGEHGAVVADVLGTIIRHGIEPLDGVLRALVNRHDESPARRYEAIGRVTTALNLLNGAVEELAGC